MLVYRLLACIQGKFMLRRLTQSPHMILLVTALIFASLLLTMDGRPFAFSDSHYYFGMAESALSGDGFRFPFQYWNVPVEESVHSREMLHFPPGYPILLMVIKLAGLNIRGHDLLVINALLLAAALYLTGALTYFFTRKLAWACFALLLVMSSYVPYGYLLAISEPWFTALLVGGMYLLVLYLNTQRLNFLLISGGLIGFMWLTRYAGLGIALAANGVVLLAQIRRDKPWRTRLLHMGVFGITSCLPIGLWLLRNQFIAHSFVGEGHTLAEESLSENIDLIAKAFTLYYGNLRNFYALLAVGIVSAAGVIAYAYRHRQALTPADLVASPVTPLGGLITVTFIYCLFILGYGGTSNTVIDARKFLPVYPLIVVCVLAFLTRPKVLNKLTYAAIILGLLVLFTGAGVSYESTPRLRIFPERVELGFRLSEEFALIVGVQILLLVAWMVWRRGRTIPQFKPVHFVIFLAFSGFFARQIFLLNDSEYFLRLIVQQANYEVIRWANDHLAAEVVYTNDPTLVYGLVDGMKPSRLKSLPRLEDGYLVPEVSYIAAETEGYILILKTRPFQKAVQSLQLSPFFTLVQEFPDGWVFQPTKSPPLPESVEISFSADDNQLERGECTMLRWDVEEIDSVFLNGNGVTGHDAREVCFKWTRIQILRVHLKDGTVVFRSLIIYVKDKLVL